MHTPHSHPDPSDIELRERRQIEIDFWRDSPSESPDADAIGVLIGKARDAGILLDLFTRYRAAFEGARSIVELGAGQGWGACIAKRLFPDARVTATDISPYAIASLPKWEHVFRTRLDAARVCTSDALPEADGSVDVIFCFAAAHHFAAHRRTLREIRRVLAPGGHAFYLYEPSCRPYLHAAAKRRVNRKRPDVPEDVLVYPEIARLAAEAGLALEVEFYPSTANRGPKETLYYALLERVPVLQRWLPCTANYHFRLA